MCGIVLVGASAMYKKDVEVFEKSLFCDTFRGPHSTGVFLRREVGGVKHGPVANHREPIVTYPMYKDAVTGPEFLKQQAWNTVRDGVGRLPVLANFYVGHNRYATVGAVNAKNAHPFRHGAITMVHNGTLMDQALLPDHLSFEVDSENVCHSLNLWGVDRTIQNLDGAFTLVWHNSETETLHIIRNEERPFHLVETECGKWFGASEGEMILWLLKRGKFPYKIKRNFEIEVGVEHVFDVSKDKFVLVEERKHELPTFLSYNSYYGTAYQPYGGGRNGANANTGGAGTHTTLPNRAGAGSSTGEGTEKSGPVVNQRNKHKYISADDLLKTLGIGARLGSVVNFRAFELALYSETTVGRGRVTGMLNGVVDYVEVQAHNVLGTEYKGDTDMYGTIVGAFESKSVLHVVVKNITEENPNTKQVIEAEDETTVKAGGKTYTQAQWARANKICCNCSSPIPFAEAHLVEYLYEQPICKECQEYVYGELAAEDFAREELKKEKESDVSDTFVCQTCTVAHPLKNESDKPGVCLDCYNYFIKGAGAPQHGDTTGADWLDTEHQGLPIDPPGDGTADEDEKKKLCTICGTYHANPLLHRVLNGKKYNVCSHCHNDSNFNLVGMITKTELNKAHIESNNCDCCDKVITGNILKRIQGKWMKLCNRCVFLSESQLGLALYYSAVTYTGKGVVKDAKKSDVTPAPESEKTKTDKSTKILYNGFRVDESNWLKMNNCRCGDKIPWAYADQAEFVGSVPLCESCKKRLI